VSLSAKPKSSEKKPLKKPSKTPSNNQLAKSTQAHAAKLEKWEAKADAKMTDPLPSWLCIHTVEQHREWLRGIYKYGRDFNWMDK